MSLLAGLGYTITQTKKKDHTMFTKVIMCALILVTCMDYHICPICHSLHVHGRASLILF